MLKTFKKYSNSNTNTYKMYLNNFQILKKKNYFY